MLQGEIAHVLELVRRLRAPPGGDEERAIIEFLRRVQEHRLPRSRKRLPATPGIR